MRILVAEDDQIAASLLENTLSEWGYEVDVVASGREAIDRLEQTDYRPCDLRLADARSLRIGTLRAHSCQPQAKLRLHPDADVPAQETTMSSKD